jgi:hypothetical protein
MLVALLFRCLEAQKQTANRRENRAQYYAINEPPKEAIHNPFIIYCSTMLDDVTP